MPLATLVFFFVQVWPKNGTFTALQDIMGVKNPRFIGHFDDGAFEKVELKPLATFGVSCNYGPKMAPLHQFPKVAITSPKLPSDAKSCHQLPSVTKRCP